MQSFINPMIINRNMFKDMIGILLILAIGIGGLIAVSDPIRMLIPKHPMLSSEDLQGSWATQEVEIIEARHWEENRELIIRLRSKDDAEGNNAEIVQRAGWYADTAEAAAMWNHPPLVGNGWQLLNEDYISREQPASRLYCRYDLHIFTTACGFFAYRGHWYTQISFSSDSTEYLSLSEIRQITNRVNQLLMSLSDEQIAASLPIQPGTLPPHYEIVIIASPAATQLNIPTLPPNWVPTFTFTPIPTIISLNTCPSFQSGETRTVSPGTFIFGDVVIDGITQYDSNIASEDTVAYFEKGSTVTAPFGADCYTGSNGSVYQVAQNLLQHGCGSKCASVRVVLVQSDGQHVKIYK